MKCPFHALDPIFQERLIRVGREGRLDGVSHYFQRDTANAAGPWVAMLLAVGLSVGVALAVSRGPPDGTLGRVIVGCIFLLSVLWFLASLREAAAALRSRTRPFTLLTPRLLVKVDYDHGLAELRRLADATDLKRIDEFGPRFAKEMPFTDRTKHSGRRYEFAFPGETHVLSIRPARIAELEQVLDQGRIPSQPGDPDRWGLEFLTVADDDRALWRDRLTRPYWWSIVVIIGVLVLVLLGAVADAFGDDPTGAVDDGAVKGFEAMPGDVPAGAVPEFEAPKEPEGKIWIWTGIIVFMAAILGLFFLIERWQRPPWKRLYLSGASAVVPRVCPNCMSPADVELRYGWHSLFFIWCQPWVGTYQTFYYCPGCAESARAHLRYRRWLTFFSYMLSGLFTSYLVFGLIAAFTAVAAAKFVSGLLPAAHAGWVGVTTGIVLGLFLFGLQFRLLSKFLFGWQKRRVPQRPEQAVWGLAAYCDDRHYTAAREQWLVELARLNPEQVPDSWWQAIFGQPKAVVEKPPPFAG